MLFRGKLRLLEALPRTRLNLLSEMDAELRNLERAHQSNPGDPEIRGRLAHTKKRAGPPDTEHKWRFNGKGWFTRPQWNDGKCPDGSEATLHNTCIDGSASGNDRAQYRQARTGDIFMRNDRDSAETEAKMRTQLAPREGGAINWDHPHGPQIYSPNQNLRPRPLPDNPEHLPPELLGSEERSYGGRSDRRREHGKLLNHYTDRGFDAGYVRKALNARQRSVTQRTYPSVDDEDRLPTDKTQSKRVLRSLSKARERAGRNPSTGREPYADNYFADYADQERRNYRQGDGGNAYPNDPNYPGHANFPNYDAHNAPLDPTDYSDLDDFHDYDDDDDDYGDDGRYDEVGTDEPNSNWTNTGRHGEPRWPRTGERRDIGDTESPDQFATQRSGRSRGSNRTSGRSHMGGGRGRTNFRGRGGARSG